ncbi:MAG: hypothetical protein ACF8PN_05075 [Phycisphaerales bacterium]
MSNTTTRTYRILVPSTARNAVNGWAPFEARTHNDPEAAVTEFPEDAADANARFLESVGTPTWVRRTDLDEATFYPRGIEVRYGNPDRPGSRRWTRVDSFEADAELRNAELADARDRGYRVTFHYHAARRSAVNATA